jgi:nitrogen fixation/metabolism regulation signal transduction histidine kinase
MRRRLGHPTRVALGALLAGAPAVLIALGYVWLTDAPARVRWTVTAVVLGGWLAGMRYVRSAVQRPMQTLANLVAALREGDYSARGRTATPGDALGELTRELNAFSDLLREQRLGDVETAALLARVMGEIDVAIITCDEHGRVRLSNRAAEAITGRPAAQALGEPLGALGLELLLEGDAPRKVALPRPVPAGRWELRRSAFRQDGRPHTLIVLTDLRRALREEERAAWQRLVRVLGHELNNSLAPIRSLAENLGGLLTRAPRPPDVDEDLARGLAVIQRRAEALNRFMGAFTALARLPAPRRERVEVAAWVRRIAALETRLPVEVAAGPAVRVDGDPDQLDQVLINLLRNAVDAARETGGAVKVGWRVEAEALELRVDDEGPGILDPSNLFVPFFTTKPSGTGIGLALSRQILENHGGAVRLENHPAGPGCAAIVTLPLPVDNPARPVHPLP